MKDIHYELEFFSYWHCGSGLASGADVDMLVVKDRDSLPFVPGKTIKGLVRDCAQTLYECDSSLDKGLLEANFGYFDNKDSKMQGKAFFSNATLPGQKAGEIVKCGLSEYLYERISSTAIDEQGIAKDNTLRSFEVVVPCILEGCIKDVDDDFVETVKKSLKMIKRLGVGRNRGLGRCSFHIKEEGGEK